MICRYYFIGEREPMAEQEKKATYEEISKISGVSKATISRILNKSTNVKPETQQKVFDVMKKLGHDTSGLIVMPQLPSSDLIIFSIPSLDNPFYSLIIQGAKAAAARHKFNLLVNEDQITERNIEELLALVKKTRAAGLIITNQVEADLLKKLDEAVPVVQCCECDKTLEIPFVTIDDVAASRSAMDYLFSLGKRRIAFINGPLRYKYARDRLAGYLAALESAGIEVDNDLVIQLQEINYDMAVSAAHQLLNSAKKPDAFFTISDVYAAAVIKAAGRVNLSVPGDLAVVGFDNIEISSMCNPAITTINQPRFQLGFLSCEILTKRILDDSELINRMYLETELIVRESTMLRNEKPKPAK